MSDLDGFKRSLLSGQAKDGKGSLLDSSDKATAGGQQSKTQSRLARGPPEASKPATNPGEGRKHSGADQKAKQHLTSLAEQLPGIGEELRTRIKALKVKDLPPKNDVVDMMSAGKERKNDVSIAEEKAFERLMAEDKSKDIGQVTCIQKTDNRELLVVGTRKMVLLVYNYKLNQIRSTKVKAKGPILSLDVNTQNEFIACGTEGGGVFLYKIREKELELVTKVDGFTKESIRDIRFVEVGLSLVAIDFAENIFFLYANLAKSKPVFEPQQVKSNSENMRLTHSKVIVPPRLDGAASKVRLLFAGGFGGSVLYRFNKGDFVQLDSLEATPFMDSRSSRKGSVLQEENYQSYCLEDYDILPWVSASEIKLLYVVKGHRVCIRYVYLSNNDELEITSFSEFNLPDSVLFATVICPGVVCILDQFLQVKFVNMRKIIKSQREENKVDFATSNYVTIKSSVLKNENILYSDEPFGRTCKNYLPFICAGKRGRFVLTMTSKKLVHFELLHWESVASSLFEEIDYLSVIQLLIEVSEGEYYKLYGISPIKDRRKEHMSEYIHSFVDQLVEKKVISGTPNPGAMMRFVTTLLVRTGNIEYLFNNFYEDMRAIGLGEELKSEIEEYFRCGQLGQITPESLEGAIVEAFDQDIQKKLLLDCFDSTDKRGQLISMAIRNKFYDLLFYMAPKHDAISSIFPLSVGTYEIDSLDPNDQPKRERLLLSILWYCDSLLKGQLMFSEPLEPDRAKQLQLTVLNWLLDPANSKSLYKHDFLFYLDLLLGGLNQRIIEHFEAENEKDPDSHKIELYQFEVLSRTSFKKFDLLFKDIRANLPKERLPVYHLFLAILMMSGLPRIKLEAATIESLMISLVKNFDQLMADKRIKLQEEDVQAIVFDVFTTNSAFLKESKGFISAAEISQSVFRVMMLETKDNFEETFNVYIRLIKDKLSHSALFFQWLKRVFTEKSDRKGANELAKPIKQNFEYLVQIGLKETQDIWSHFENNLKIDSTLALEDAPKVQLDFLSRVMRIGEDKDSKLRVPDHIKLLYFERLCQFRPEEVIEQLKKNNWPTLECLDRCQKYKVELGIAYINERLGKYFEALDIYKNRFARFVNEFRSKIAGKNEKHFYEEVFNEDVKDGNLFKLHPLCSAAAQEYLLKLQEEHGMFRSLATASDNKLEVPPA